MKQMSKFALGFGKHLMVGSLLIGGLAGTSGCVVRTAYAPPPPAPYYYRTRLVYTPYGPQYVRERVYYPPYANAPTYYPPADGAPPGAPPPPVSSTGPAATNAQAVAELHPLVAPIALYPDPLVAVLLPACSYPQQLQDASTWLAAHPQPPSADIDAQPWDPSVKALVHYPSVLEQLNRDPKWTQSLGSAFTRGPAEVMAAIQDMRSQAAAEGNLIDTPQQQIVRDGGVIAIQPADPNEIYIPEYDPVLVYDGYHPLVFASVAYPIGPWFSFGLFWGGGFIYHGDWHGGYYFRGGHWGYDRGFRYDRYSHWSHDGRFGAAPAVERGHYEMRSDVRGREMQIHNSMGRHWH